MELRFGFKLVPFGEDYRSVGVGFGQWEGETYLSVALGTFELLVGRVWK